MDPDQKLDDAHILAACEQLGLLSDTDDAPSSGLLQGEVAEGGENLSHGRRQELALCRALLVRPAIVLLDESTSALDPAREARLTKSLLAAFPERTTVVSVAHRLGSVVSYDRVLVMGDGRILEDGRPRELLKKPMGFFSALWRAAGEKPHY